MTSLLARAPGKLFLGGEYAVLEGAVAVVTAVDRWAIARVTGAPSPRQSPVLDAAFRHVLEAISAPPCHVTVDSGDLFDRGKKIGLGSSAAVCAAAVGLQMEVAGRPVKDNREEVLAIASTAHRDAQGGVGSGADVAVSCLGGTISYTVSGGASPLPRPGVRTGVVWTGKSARTCELVDRVNELGRRDPSDHAAMIGDMTVLAASLASAYAAEDFREIVELTARYGELMGRLGEAAGVAIVNEDHAMIMRAARRFGGAAKPSGAGGGDVAVAVFEGEEQEAGFQTWCRDNRVAIVDLRLHAPGLQVIPRCESRDPVRGSRP